MMWHIKIQTKGLCIGFWDFFAYKAALLDFFGHTMQKNVNTTFKYNLIKFLWRIMVSSY